MEDYRYKVVYIKERLSKFNEEYFNDMCSEDRHRLIEITGFIDKFLYNPYEIDLLNSSVVELNYLNSYNKVDKKRRYLFRANIVDIVRDLTNMLED